MSARSRSVTFIAATDVLEFLNSLESGLKSKVINRALRQYMAQVDPDDVLGEGTSPSSSAYPSAIQKSELQEFAEWLEKREESKDRSYQLRDEDDTHISLVKLLKIFGRRRTHAGRILAEIEEGPEDSN